MIFQINGCKNAYHGMTLAIKKIIKKCYNDDYLVTLYAEGDM